MADERTAAASGAPNAPERGEVGHPAPSRARVSGAALWFGLVGAPAAWTVQTLVNLPFASHACYPRLFPLGTPTAHVRPIVAAVSVAAILLCAAGVLVAWRSWRLTHDERQEGSGRGREHAHGTAVLEIGEGRTRFMAYAGLLASLLFLVASAAHAGTLLFVGPCGL